MCTRADQVSRHFLPLLIGISEIVFTRADSIYCQVSAIRTTEKKSTAATILLAGLECDLTRLGSPSLDCGQVYEILNAIRNFEPGYWHRVLNFAQYSGIKTNQLFEISAFSPFSFIICSPIHRIFTGSYSCIIVGWWRQQGVPNMTREIGRAFLNI